MCRIHTKKFNCVLFTMMVALTVYLLSHNSVIETNKTFKNVNISRQIDTSMDCFKNLKDALPDLSTIHPDWKRSIFFIEVSCGSSKSGRISILPRQACAIESAAFTNPDFDIYVLYASRGAIENQGSLSDYLLEVVGGYKNVRFLHFDINSLVNGSIVESLYRENKVQSAVFPMIVNSDMSRMLVLQKYGGFYLDLDVIVIKKLANLPSNCVSPQSEIVVNGAVFRVDNSTVGRSFTKLCLEELKNNFDGSNWATTGPAVVTETMKKMCGVKQVLSMPTLNCSGVSVLPVDTFYPVRWEHGKKYFETQKSGELLNRILKNTYVVHVWNKITSGFVASEAPNSIYNTLAKNFCPRVYKHASKYF